MKPPNAKRAAAAAGRAHAPLPCKHKSTHPWYLNKGARTQGCDAVVADAQTQSAGVLVRAQQGVGQLQHLVRPHTGHTAGVRTCVSAQLGGEWRRPLVGQVDKAREHTHKRKAFLHASLQVLFSSTHWSCKAKWGTWHAKSLVHLQQRPQASVFKNRHACLSICIRV